MVQKSSFFLLVFILSIAGCEMFNNPMKSFIEKASKRTFSMPGDKSPDQSTHTIITPHFVNVDGGFAAVDPFISPITTVIHIHLNEITEYDGPFSLDIDSGNSSFSANAVVTAELNAEGDIAIITIDRFSRGDVFDLTLNLRADGGIIASYSPPRLEARCRDTALAALAINAPPEAELDFAFYPDGGITSYTVTLSAPGTEYLSISAARRSPYSTITLNGSSINGNITNQAITLAPGANEITIQVRADSGETRDYNFNANMAH